MTNDLPSPCDASRARSRRWLPYALLLLSPLLALLIRTQWSARSEVILTGDEPHYLLFSKALLHFRLGLRPEYAEENRTREVFGDSLDPHVFTAPDGAWYGVHYPLLPLLVAVPFAAGGAAAARFVMICLAGFVPFLFFRVLRRETDAALLSAFLALALCIGLPYTAVSSQVYPDLPVGIAVLFAVILLRDARRTAMFSLRAAAAVCALTACLPWFHFKGIGPLGVLFVWYLWVVWGQRSAPDFRAKLALALAPVLSGIGILAYNFACFHNPMGPVAGSQTYRIGEWGMILLGLHLDQSHGVFFEQPLLLLGLAGVPFLFFRDRREFLVLAVLYVSMTLPNAMHETWYGGYSISGRFMLSASVLWILPLAAGLRAIPAVARSLAAWLAAAVVFVQLVEMHFWWALQPARLYNALPVRNSIYPYAVRYLLPSYYDFDGWYKAPVNWCSIVVCLALVAAGFLVRSGRWRRACVVVGTAAILFVVAVSATYTRLSAGVKHPGSLPGGAPLAVASFAQNRPGDNAIHTKALELQPGRYTATFFLKGQCAGPGAAAAIQAASLVTNLLVTADVPCRSLGETAREFPLHLTILGPVRDVEFWTLDRGARALAVEKVEIRPD